MCSRANLSLLGLQWYTGTLQEYNPSEGTHLVVYDDGDSSWYNLGEITYRLLGEADPGLDVGAWDRMPPSYGVVSR